MPAKHRLYVSFPSQEKLHRAKQKAAARKKTPSKLVREFFENLPATPDK